MIDFVVWSFEIGTRSRVEGDTRAARGPARTEVWPSSPVEWRGNEAVAEPERAEYLHSFPPRKRSCFVQGTSA